MVVSIPRLLAMLRDEYGEPHWWPGDTAFEVAVGAILTQRSSWRNAETSTRNLKSARLLSPGALVACPLADLEEIIRSSGFFRQKARYLKAFSTFVVNAYGGDLERMKPRPTNALRGELLGLPGIGSETADSILLYALGKAIFVVDAYTYRLMRRLGYEQLGDYDVLQAMVQRSLRSNVKDMSDMHALIVIHCKEKCRKTPDCAGCVLSSVCPSKRK